MGPGGSGLFVVDGSTLLRSHHVEKKIVGESDMKAAHRGGWWRQGLIRFLGLLLCALDLALGLGQLHHRHQGLGTLLAALLIVLNEATESLQRNDAPVILGEVAGTAIDQGLP